MVLDNCEHLIEAAAHMAEALLRASPGVCVVATSREPSASGRRSTSTGSRRSTSRTKTTWTWTTCCDTARSSSSWRARRRPSHGSCSTAELASAAAAICRHLDGIPLAIELAAARIAAFGVEGVASRLDDRFRLLTGGSRTALPRQQTLRATLDWSHDLLADPERVLLRRLAVMAGSFSLHAAASIAAGPELADGDVVECVANLVAKSLVAVDLGGAVTSYRLLETTRAYARREARRERRGRALQRGATPSISGISSSAPHAEWHAQPTAEWLATYGPALDDLRAALDWAFASGGDAALGVALTIAAVPLWFQLSLLGECRDACRARAVDARRDCRGAMPAPRCSCRRRSAGR